MHHLTCGISSLLHSVNLNLFTLLMVHLILHTSPHHSPCHQSRHLSLPQPFMSKLKLICFTNLFLHSLFHSLILTAFTDSKLYSQCYFSFFFYIFYFVVTCAKLSSQTVRFSVHVKLPTYHIKRNTASKENCESSAVYLLGSIRKQKNCTSLGK